MSLNEVDLEGFRGSDQGKQMKDTIGWYENTEGFNSSGFSGKPNNFYDYSIDEVHGGSENAMWWTATGETVLELAVDGLL